MFLVAGHISTASFAKSLRPVRNFLHRGTAMVADGALRRIMNGSFAFELPLMHITFGVTFLIAARWGQRSALFFGIANPVGNGSAITQFRYRINQKFHQLARADGHAVQRYGVPPGGLSVM